MTLCHDCGVDAGEFHKRGCDVERCCLCGGQALACGCIYELNGIVDLETENPEVYENGPTGKMLEVLAAEENKFGGRLPWTGEWPDADACREFDLWCYWDEQRGWVDCLKSHPKATENLNRLPIVARWDKQRRRWVRS